MDRLEKFKEAYDNLSNERKREVESQLLRYALFLANADSKLTYQKEQDDLINAIIKEYEDNLPLTPLNNADQ
jgi:hypothetical protein